MPAALGVFAMAVPEIARSALSRLTRIFTRLFEKPLRCRKPSCRRMPAATTCGLKNHLDDRHGERHNAKAPPASKQPTRVPISWGPGPPGPGRRRLLLLLLLTHCAADRHAPAFAQSDYAPFSRSAAVAVALDEWRLWGMRVDDDGDAGYVQTDATMGERQPGLWQRVGEYWWEGMNANEPDARYTGKHDAAGDVFPVAVNGAYAWSAAFISYVMRIAGAGAAFPYAPDHATYINYAARAARGGVADPLLLAEDPARYAPRLGDLVCLGRGWARGLTFADLPTTTRFPAHCAIVTGGGAREVSIIGGNVEDAVTLEHLRADATGRLAGNRDRWFVILRVLYRVN